MTGSAEVCQAAEVLVAVGSYKRFLDEPAALTGGVAVKIPVSSRFSVRSEYLADNSKNYPNRLVLGSLVGDFTDPDKRAVGYWVASAGGVRTGDEYIAFNAWRWALFGGVGVRFAIRERWTAAAEFRAGWPAFPLVTFNVGYRWGKGK
jgi:hypothetical protein